MPGLKTTSRPGPTKLLPLLFRVGRTVSGNGSQRGASIIYVNFKLIGWMLVLHMFIGATWFQNHPDSGQLVRDGRHRRWSSSAVAPELTEVGANVDGRGHTRKKWYRIGTIRHPEFYNTRVIPWLCVLFAIETRVPSFRTDAWNLRIENVWDQIIDVFIWHL